MWDRNASYGAALQNLRYTDARHQGPVLATPTKWQKGLYGLLSIGGRYGWTKWEDWLADHDGGYEEVHRGSTIYTRTNILTVTSQVQTSNCSLDYRLLLQRAIQLQPLLRFSSF